MNNGIDEATSMHIFDKIEKFASYGFNKSHAAAYGYLSYVTAYLKANYPSEWMAALMTSDRDDLSKVDQTYSAKRKHLGFPFCRQMSMSRVKSLSLLRAGSVLQWEESKV